LEIEQPAVLYALLFSNIITNLSSFDLEDENWRYPHNMDASFMDERSNHDTCSVVNADRRVSSGVVGSEIELYGANKLVSEVEVVSKEEIEGPTR